jgi:hypothetical protein
MSRRKKSVGKVKPSWVGKTRASLIKRIELALDPRNKGSTPKRVTDNRKAQVSAKTYYGGRTSRARAETKAAAKAYPIGSWVSVRWESTLRTVGKIVRIYGGKYTIQTLYGTNVRVPYYAIIQAIHAPSEPTTREQT